MRKRGELISLSAKSKLNLVHFAVLSLEIEFSEYEWFRHWHSWDYFEVIVLGASYWLVNDFCRTFGWQIPNEMFSVLQKLLVQGLVGSCLILIGSYLTGLIKSWFTRYVLIGYILNLTCYRVKTRSTKPLQASQVLFLFSITLCSRVISLEVLGTHFCTF